MCQQRALTTPLLGNRRRPARDADRRVKRGRELDAAMGLPPEPEEPAAEPTPLTDEAVEAAFECRARNWDRCRRVLDTHDVLVSATTPMIPRSVEEWGISGRGFMRTTYSAHTAMFNAVGMPAVSAPCGFVDGLPVGMQIVALPGREDLIFRVAAGFQAAHPPVERPRFA